ncbi:hypothetical protein RHSIM_Rhsim02G0146800 [Rhododendron simsii]|uniref:Uncharacterized protein n=1 Tax=Rhododendron simsii TaxID=118357 RepID=A0A834LX64_RHOSS|nr:hypothetical protein RHSIM_Rhsim02G0146800 [Rhododendron simsii]
MTCRCQYGVDLAKQLTVSLHNVLVSCGSVSISFSRRIPAKISNLIVKEFGNHPKIYIWDGEEPNPHMGHLAWGDAFVVTADSVSMVSEACSTGKPVYVIGMECCTWKFVEFQKSLRERGLVRLFTGLEGVTMELGDRYWDVIVNDHDEAVIAEAIGPTVNNLDPKIQDTVQRRQVVSRSQQSTPGRLNPPPSLQLYSHAHLANMEGLIKGFDYGQSKRLEVTSPSDFSPHEYACKLPSYDSLVDESCCMLQSNLLIETIEGINPFEVVYSMIFNTHKTHGLRAGQEGAKKAIGFVEAFALIGKQDRVNWYWKGNLPQVLCIFGFEFVHG